jgi:hypothetical protein
MAICFQVDWTSPIRNTCSSSVNNHHHPQSQQQTNSNATTRTKNNNNNSIASTTTTTTSAKNIGNGGIIYQSKQFLQQALEGPQAEAVNSRRRL